MKHSLGGTQKKNHHALTPMVIAGGKKGAEKDKKQDTNQCSPAVAPNLIPLYIARCSLSVSLPQYSFSFPLHRIPSLYSSVSPTLPSFITLMKKNGGVLWRYSTGADECWQRRSREMKRGEERGATHTQRKYDTMFPCNANWIRSLSCAKELESSLRQRGHAESLLYVATQRSVQAHTHWTWNMVQYSHSHAALVESVLIKLHYFLKWLMLTLSIINRERQSK